MANFAGYQGEARNGLLSSQLIGAVIDRLRFLA
jgi:hypothetical protein